MNVTVNSKQLLKELQFCQKAISSTPIYPLLGCFLLDIAESQINIAATNNAIYLKAVCGCQSDGKGAYAVPADKLTAVLKQMPDMPLKFTFKDGKITIKSSTGTYTFPTEDAANFNVIENKPKHTLSIDGALLSKAIRKGLFAVAQTEEIPALSSVNIDFSTDKMTVTGCNRYILSTWSYAIESSVTATVLIPKNAAAICEFTGQTDIIIAKNSIGFYFGDRAIISLLTAEKYPDYKNVIPLDGDKFLHADREQFASAVNRAKTLSNRNTFQLRLSLGNTITVSGEDIDFKQSSLEVVDAQYTGDRFEIGSNGEQAALVLANLEGAEITAAMSAENRPIVFTEGDKSADGKENLMLVMPVMI